MTIFADMAEVKNVTFNGQDVERVFVNGKQIFEKSFVVFDNGVFDNNCEMTNGSTFTIQDSKLYGKASVSKSSNSSYKHLFITNIDFSNHKYLYIEGDCNMYAGNNGSCYVSCGIGTNQYGNLIYNIESGKDSYSFSYRVEIPENAGTDTFSLLAGVHVGTDDEEKYTECFIRKIFLT